jgi:hypothetical protein
LARFRLRRLACAACQASQGRSLPDGACGSGLAQAGNRSFLTCGGPGPDPGTALTPAAPVIHHPIDAPIVYLDQDRLAPETRAALERMRPESNAFGRNARAVVPGSLLDNFVREAEDLGFEVRPIQGAPAYRASMAARSAGAAGSRQRHPAQQMPGHAQRRLTAGWRIWHDEARRRAGGPCCLLPW